MRYAEKTAVPVDRRLPRPTKTTNFRRFWGTRHEVYGGVCARGVGRA